MSVIATIEAGDVTRTILGHLGLPTEPPTPLSARPPPGTHDLFPTPRLDRSVPQWARPLPGCPRMLAGRGALSRLPILRLAEFVLTAPLSTSYTHAPERGCRAWVGARGWRVSVG